jgi:5,10-methylenetetrahydromethanopterin reductase
VTTAAALATLNCLAPGRIAAGVGTGFTGSRLLGQPPMRWRDVYEYVSALRALLRGEEASWDGAPIRLVPSPDFERSLPVEIPIVVAADGPKGRQVARDLGAGLCTTEPAFHEGFESLATTFFGTVLEEGESPESDRVFAAAGPGASIVYHAIYHFQGAAGIDRLPGGAAWRERIEAFPADRRHLEIHRGHGHLVNELDSELIPREMVSGLTVTGTADEVRESVAKLGAMGITEVLFNPAGADIPRELERFAEATSSLRDTPSIGETGASV